MDGLNCFKQLFPNDDELVDYVIRNTLFFKKILYFSKLECTDWLFEWGKQFQFVILRTELFSDNMK